MKRFLYLVLFFLIFGCNTAPTIIPDTTKDNVVMEKLKYDITHNTHISGNWGWILWYLPLVVIALMWAWRQFMKPCPQCDSKQTEIPK